MTRFILSLPLLLLFVPHSHEIAGAEDRPNLIVVMVEWVKQWLEG